jgi:hypothetical protein
MGKKMSNMENSFDDGSHLSPQNLGSSSPGRKQSKENTITVSGLTVGGEGSRAGALGHSWGCCHGNVDRQPESMLTGKQRSCSQILDFS